MRLRFIKKAVSLVVILSFILSNLAYTAPADYKLAAQGQVPQLSRLPLGDLGCLLRGSKIADELGVTDLPSLLANIERLSERGIICFVLADKEDKSKTARYIFVRNGMFIRVTGSGETVNDDFSRLLRISPKEEIIEGKRYQLCTAARDEIDLINSFLREIDPSWGIEAFEEGSPVKPHLFQRFLHDALADKLKELGWVDERIQRVLNKGLIFFDETKNKIVRDEEAIRTAAEVLNDKLHKTGTETETETVTETVTTERIIAVLELHEEIHSIIKAGKINIPALLKKLREYYAKAIRKDKDSAEVAEALNNLFCDFARNYNYLPGEDLSEKKTLPLAEKEQLMLLEEMVVHSFVEMAEFRHPLKVWRYNDSVERDIGPDTENIILGQTAGVIGKELKLETEEIIAIFSGIRFLGIDSDIKRNYFSMLYSLFLNKWRLILRIGRNFIPSALLPDRESKMGVKSYSELLKEKEGYTERAKRVRLLLNPMDGGEGKEIERKEYLKKRGIEVEDGSKGGDLSVFDIRGTGDYVSIMEAKLLRAIWDAESKGYGHGHIEYQILGSEESQKSFERLLNKKMFNPKLEMRDPDAKKYREYLLGHKRITVKFEIQEGMKIPAIDREKELLTTEVLGHGNHGMRGVIFLQEAAENKERIEPGEDVIRVIYNGDGINNGVDPVIAGWMAEGEKNEKGEVEKIPIVMLTTTKTPIDRKGGILGIQILDDKDEKGNPQYKVQIMEIAQARAVGQEELFMDVGLSSGSYTEVKGNKSEEGKQYFNTNTVLMNLSVLQPFLSELVKIIGKEEFSNAMSPVLIVNQDKSSPHLAVLEGALSSVILALAGYLKNTKNQRVKELMKKHGFSQFLRIVNIEEEHRASLFTPIKESTDYWFLHRNDRYKLNFGTMRLEDKQKGGRLPSFELANRYTDDYKDYYRTVTNVEDAFKDTDIVGLTVLEVPWRPVIFGKTVLKGRVAIINMRKREGGIVSLEDQKIKKKLLRKKKDHKLEGISVDEDGRLVFENVCVVVGDREVFVSKLEEEDGDINSGYFSRLFYQLYEKDKEKHKVSGILRYIAWKTYQRLEKDPLTKPMPDLISDREAKDYVRPTTEFDHPKYDADANIRPFDGVSIVCDIPNEGGLGKLLKELSDKINESKKENRAEYIAVNNIENPQFTICILLSVGDFEEKWRYQLNEETKREIEELSKILQGKGVSVELSSRRAAYTVVSQRVAGALKRFEVWRNPRFRVRRFDVTTFPTDGGRTTLALVLEPEGPGDLAIITKLRDIVKKETGISDAFDFKKHVTTGYFVRKFEDAKDYDEFRKFVEGLNNDINSQLENAWIEFGSFRLACYMDMENFETVVSLDWEKADVNRRNVEAVDISRKIEHFVREIKPQEEPEDVADGPIGKRAGGGYAELAGIEVVDGKLSEGRDMGDAAKSHSKYGKIDRDALLAAVKRLTDDAFYGPGILSVIDEIRIVDNIDAGTGAELLPYAKIGRGKDGRNILYLDVDAFDNPDVLFIELEHELGESIIKILPDVNENIRELTANYMSLKFALEKIKKGEMDLGQILEKLPELGADLQFFLALKALVESDVNPGDNEKIAAVAVEHMRSMPYYAELFKGFPFAQEWQDRTAKIKDAVERYKAAIGIFNSIAEAKKETLRETIGKAVETAGFAVTARRTFTGLRVDGLDKMPRGLAEMIGAIAKQIGSAEKFSAMLAEAEDKKYLLVSEDKLQHLKDAMGERDYSLMEGNLKKNNFEICTSMPEGVSPENIGRLVDPSDLENMPEREKIKGMFYLPVPYTRSAVYMTALILQAKGDLNQVPLVKESIGELYRGLSGDDLIKLITAPWLILPKIQPVIAEINNLRRAIDLIEKAA